MKCISKKVLCLVGVVTILISGCGSSAASTNNNTYNSLTYNNSFLNDPNIASTQEFYADELCVTDPVDFGTEGTYSYCAGGAGIFNVTQNKVLYNHNMFGQLHPASTTKILTAYIILRDCDLSETVIISKKAATQASDSSVMGLNEGDRITVLNLLRGLLIRSGNDAADALAEHHSGSIEAFAKEMTKTAHSLGATNSHFANPSGLTDKEHYTTVYDMYLFFNEAIKNEKFVEIISARNTKISWKNYKGNPVNIESGNPNWYIGGKAKTPSGFTVIGGKTGTTFAAKYCNVVYLKNAKGDDIIAIVFKADCKENLYLYMSQILYKYAK